MKQTNNENSKEKILNAATKLFAKKGFDGVSIREICKEAGINICMISYYFGGKNELYQSIINNLQERAIAYAKTFLDFDKNPGTMSREEKIDLLLEIADKFAEYFYANVSGDLITIMLKEQQKPDFIANSPLITYVRSIVADILNKDLNDREVIFKTLFIFSQINSPRILMGFSLRLLGQEDFVQEDIKIIKENVKFYIKSLLKEAKVD